MSYIYIPKHICYTDLLQKSSFSCKNYEGVFVENKNYKKMGELLIKELRGREIGSNAYISDSSYFFVRTGSLDAHNFLLSTKTESLVPMNPSEYIDMKLQKGQIIISKDGNVGECVILDKDYKNYLLCGGLVCIDIENSIKTYCFAFMKTDFFKEQLYQKISKGATLLHAKDLRKDCIIPFPNQSNSDEVIHYISLLVQSIISKEQAIQKKYNQMMDMIEEELGIQASKSSQTINYNDLIAYYRLDTGLYTQTYLGIKKAIEKYKHGWNNIEGLGYSLTRGQNLQVSSVGTSIYSKEYKQGFYKLALSRQFTEYMTITNYEYIGNAKNLKTIKQGDIIFSCRGDMGRCLVFCDDIKNTITNIDNVHIRKTGECLLSENIFLGVFLNFLAHKGYIKAISITGSGADSFTQYHFDLLQIPNFPNTLKQQIATHYYNHCIYPETVTLENFTSIDGQITTSSGIIQLDAQIKAIKQQINKLVDSIIKDEKIDINWEFLKGI